MGFASKTKGKNMIDWMKDNDKAVDFVKERLVKVTDLLNEIAMETGQVYVVMPMSVIGSFAKLGARWGSWMIDAQKVCADRILIANEHEDWMLGKYGDELLKPIGGPSGADVVSPKEHDEGKLTPTDLAETVSPGIRSLKPARHPRSDDSPAGY